MTIRRAINYSKDIEKLRATRDIRAMYVARAAAATEDGFEQFKIALERVIDPDAGVHQMTWDELREGG
jgi:hypothetical protein